MKLVDSSDCDDDALPRMVSHPSGNQPRKRPGGSGTSTQCPSLQIWEAVRLALRALSKRYSRDPYLGTDVRVIWMIYHPSLAGGVSRGKEWYQVKKSSSFLTPMRCSLCTKIAHWTGLGTKSITWAVPSSQLIMIRYRNDKLLVAKCDSPKSVEHY